MMSLLPSLPTPTPCALLQPVLPEPCLEQTVAFLLPAPVPGCGGGGGSCLRLSCVYFGALVGSWCWLGRGAVAAAGLDNSGKRGPAAAAMAIVRPFGHFPHPLQHQLPADGFMSSLFAASAYFGGQAPRARTGWVPAGTPSPRCWPQTVLTAGQ